jgi:hypothetical protein
VPALRAPAIVAMAMAAALSAVGGERIGGMRVGVVGRFLFITAAGVLGAGHVGRWTRCSTMP